MGYVFISYSTKNQSYADAMRELLRDYGVRTWMAPGDIPAGSKYAQVISRAVKDCSCLVLILSEEAQNSVWVAKEVERAVNYRKPIIPVQIEDVILNDEFELYISTDQVVAVQKIDRYSKEIQGLISSIKSFVGEIEVESTIVNNNSNITNDLQSIQKAFPELSNIEYIDSSFGDVYKAFDSEKNLDIAVKLYPSSMAIQTPIFYDSDLFFQIKKIKGGNICHLIDRQMYLLLCVVMEYKEGTTLNEYLNTSMNLKQDVKVIINLMLGILNGLKLLHEKNIYYGDLTPYNIIVDSNNVPWLCDFNSANYNDSKYMSNTIVISGNYCSPEKILNNNRIDFRSDVYEFGAVLSDCLSLVVNNKNVYTVFSEIIRKSTNNNPNERYQSVDEIIVILTDLLNSVDQ